MLEAQNTLVSILNPTVLTCPRGHHTPPHAGPGGAGGGARIRHGLAFSFVCVARALGHAVDMRVGFGMPLGAVCTALFGFCARLPLTQSVAYVYVWW